eukprot:3392736-Alexandrium_andersonii.AAC.1
MSASLVGSEMCIRDRPLPAAPRVNAAALLLVAAWTKWQFPERGSRFEANPPAPRHGPPPSQQGHACCACTEAPPGPLSSYPGAAQETAA